MTKILLATRNAAKLVELRRLLEGQGIEVLGLADRVLVIREGRLVHEAPADELDEHRVLDLVMVTQHGTKESSGD